MKSRGIVVDLDEVNIVEVVDFLFSLLNTYHVPWNKTRKERLLLLTDASGA